ncbi:MAG: iron-sulfur cluster assembly scaffold protein [Planctomycetes bacterium]|nr:iron-sulfur cluster assembly scaffold protein [Planctomycetota bacterium]
MGPRLVELARSPVGLENLEGSTHEASGENPVCGDRLRFAAHVDEGVLDRLRFRATACPACVAVASCASLVFDGAAWPLTGIEAALQRAVDERGGLTRFEQHALRLVVDVLQRLAAV